MSVSLHGLLIGFPSPYCIRKKYPVLHGLKEQQNINVLQQELEKCK